MMELLVRDRSKTKGRSMMCPCCDLPLYPKDERFKFFLLSCRACGHETQLDHEFSWEICKINKKSILPRVKLQRGDTCCPNAAVTVVESGYRSQCAKEGKIPPSSLSVDDLVGQHEERMGPDFTWESHMEIEQGTSRLKIIKELLETKGVVTKEEFKSKKQSGTRYKAKADTARRSFAASCKKILQGSLLYTVIPLSKTFDGLSGDDIYVANVSQLQSDLECTITYHAVVLVGFGVKDNMRFFRFMNSHGTAFGKDGFSNVRAEDVKSVTSFKPLLQ